MGSRAGIDPNVSWNACGCKPKPEEQHVKVVLDKTMDGDIGVAEQLGKEAEQCLGSLARKMQLFQTNLDLHQGRETTAEEKERELLQCIKDLKDLELVYNHEAEDAHKKLAQKGAEFQELTTQASERLSVKVLQQETVQLQSLIGGLQAEEARLLKEVGEVSPFPPVNTAAVSSLLAKSRELKKRFRVVVAEHEKVCAAVRGALTKAGAGRVPRQTEQVEQEYCRLLEEAIEDMTLVQVEMELEGASASQVPGQLAAEAAMGTTIQATLNRIALLRDAYDRQMRKLSVSVRPRVSSKRQLAEKLGLPQDENRWLDRNCDDAVPDSTAEDYSGDHLSQKQVSTNGAIVDDHQTAAAAVAEVAALSAEQRRQNKNTIHVKQIVLDSDSE